MKLENLADARGSLSEKSQTWKIAKNKKCFKHCQHPYFWHGNRKHTSTFLLNERAVYNRPSSASHKCCTFIMTNAIYRHFLGIFTMP